MKQKNIPILFLGVLAAFPLLTFDLYQPALPEMTKYFNTTQTLGQLTLGINLLFYGLGQLVWGSLIDHYGRRKTLPATLILFILATVICVCATNITLLLIGRALQGFFCSSAHILAFSSVSDISDNTQKARTFSILLIFITLSPTIGPVLGGFIFIYSNWQMLFVTMLFIAIAILWGSIKYITESPFFKETNEKLKITSAVKRDLIAINLPYVRKSMFLQTLTFSSLMLVIFNISYFVINDLKFEPQYLGYFFGLSGLTVIFGNVLGMKLRRMYSLVTNIRIGAVVMLTGAIMLVISGFVFGLSVQTLFFILIMNLGSSLINPPVSALALSKMQKLAGSITGVINTFRSVMSAGIAFAVGILVTQSFYVFTTALLVFAMLAVYAAFVLYKK